jgi:hypothetical protein
MAGKRQFRVNSALDGYAASRGFFGISTRIACTFFGS